MWRSIGTKSFWQHARCVLLLWAATDTAVAAGFDGAQLEASIKDETYRQITSVLVAKDGQLDYAGYFGGADANTLHNTRSATKSVTAMAVGAAIDDGFLKGVDSKAFAAFARERPFRFSSSAKDAITVRDLLTMSSALACNDNEWSSPGNEEHMHPARRWLYFVLDLPVEESYARNERGFGPFRYCTAGSFLLGQIVERVAERPIDRYTQQRLLSPLGIDTVRWYRSPSQEVQTGGGLEMTSRALLALAELVRNDGRHGDRQLLSRDWVQEMLTVHVQANAVQGYGYQWWHQPMRCGAGTVDVWYMAGNGGNKVALIRELNLSVVVTATLYGTRGMHEQSTSIIEDHVLAQQAACRS